MPTSTIQSVDYVNSFPSNFGDANGQLHAYRYVFADGVEGTANHKAAPSWGRGHQVDYTINGQHQGVNKLKVGKPGSQAAFGGAGAPPAAPSAAARAQTPPPAQAAHSGPPAASGGAIHGATAGMCVKIAAEWAREIYEPQELGSADCHRWIWSQASNLARTAHKLEHGQTCKSDNWLSEGKDDVRMEYSPPPTPLPPPRQPAPKPQPGPEGAAFPEGEDDPRVPF